MKNLFGILPKRFIQFTVLALMVCFLLPGCAPRSTPEEQPKEQAGSAIAPSPDPPTTPTPEPYTPFVREAINKYNAINTGELQFRDGETWPACSDETSAKLTELIEYITDGKHTDFKEFYEALSGSDDEAERAKLACVAYNVQAFIPNRGEYMAAERNGYHQNYISRKFTGFFDDAYLGEPMDPAFADKLIFSGALLYDQGLFAMYFLGKENFSDNPALLPIMDKVDYWEVFHKTIDYYKAANRYGRASDDSRLSLIIAPERRFLQALCFLEKNAGQYGQANDILTSFEQSMSGGSFKDERLNSYGSLARLANYSRENPEFSKVLLGIKEFDTIQEFEGYPRVLNALASAPEELDANRGSLGVEINARDYEMPKDIKANTPRPGYFVLYIVPDPKADATSYRLGASNFTGSESPNFQTATCLVDEAQILVTASYQYSSYKTYVDDTGKYKLRIMRAKVKITAKNLETGAVVAESTLTASVQDQYRASPGTLYESTLKDSDINKFIAKVDKAMKKKK